MDTFIKSYGRMGTGGRMECVVFGTGSDSIDESLLFFQEAVCGEGCVFAGDHDDFQAKISWSTVFGGSRGAPFKG